METIPDLKVNYPFGLVIFGVTGDLARRKLLPALYELHRVNRLPGKLVLIGFARRDWAMEIFKKIWLRQSRILPGQNR